MSDTRDIILRASGIHHTYHSGGVATPVLHGIDLELGHGEFLCIAGPSGCGKSTLLNILGLMMQPTGGTVDIDGVATASLKDGGRTALRRDKIGVVFLRVNLLPVWSVEKNVAIALKLRGRSVDGQAVAVLERVGLADKCRSKPSALSVGEQQRVAIARAVVGRPRLLLADEPTGNLDSGNAERVLDLLVDLNRSEGLAIVMITHNKDLLVRADRVLTMRDGRFL